MTRFSQEQWAVLSRLLDEALDLPDGNRAAWLAERRADHPELAPELESLLGREPNIEANGFLSDALSAELPRPFTLAGQTLGAYVLERPLGEGGMGSVWLARRNDGLFEGAATIKFLSLAVAGPAGEARFRREGSVLARLTHPNVARLLGAGVSAAGLPYLVLEYIAGQPIDEWCDARRLSVDARLRLVQQVLDAVAHAHANFIVHRDLKPANILVTNDGTVKLLDFGIAKLLEEGGAASNTLTGAHESLFTYRYAAPEQIRGEHIATATDVYALGVILYELLAGRHPTSEECTTPASHIVAVLNTEPAQLSRAATTSGTQREESTARRAEARDTSPEKLQRVLAGDLDNIASKAPGRGGHAAARRARAAAKGVRRQERRDRPEPRPSRGAARESRRLRGIGAAVPRGAGDTARAARRQRSHRRDIARPARPHVARQGRARRGDHGVSKGARDP